MSKEKKRTILLIEDDPRVCSFINKGLTEEGFTLTIAFDGETGLEFLTTTTYDLIILDIMLPNINGLEVCKKIRGNNTKIPILFLTALGSAENVVQGLTTGADDYLVKPFKFIELVARIKNLLRRSDIFLPLTTVEEIYTFLDLIQDDNTKTVTRDGQEISLTSTEYRLLLVFMQSPKKVFSRIELLEDVWGVNFDMGTNVVDVYVNYLRKKLEKYGGSRLIHTVIGMGYVLKENG
ncbi:response regulator transcription factor [Arenibacter sp. GZD96]|uniref:response regulator transcription factor n=1 Tax=Aurantibrevibacter litoralis TaxID=3106030 RepID=UPI002AFDDCE9|nr:response regulator transcription factor [Arenibacter sp. GZD-96]MEA1785687.1 response regulator transcription factor [Arenibacter sp. GZD-96]